MDGQQLTAYEAVMKVACQIQEGMYGTGEDIDVEALESDLDDATADIG